jgi:hypothetical protein
MGKPKLKESDGRRNHKKYARKHGFVVVRPGERPKDKKQPYIEVNEDGTRHDPSR